jgi:hypothetical protein
VDNRFSRGHLSDSGRAYLGHLLKEPFRQETRDRSLSNLKKGKNLNVSPNPQKLRGTNTDIEWAVRLGVSLRLLEYAGEVHKLFKQHPVLREKFEWRILTDSAEQSMNLARVVTEIQVLLSPHSGHHKTGGNRQLELCVDWFKEAPIRFKDYDKWAESAKQDAEHALLDVFAPTLPKELQRKLERKLRHLRETDVG